MPIMKKIQLEEVMRHNTPQDCWIIIANQVFDITSFLDKHPGGKNIILKFAGKDCTEIFFRIHGNKSFSDILTPFYVGDLDL